MAFFQTKHLWIQQLADGVAVLMLDRAESSANFLDLAMLDELEQALDKLVNEKNFRLVVIRSAKTANFCSGPSPGVFSSWTTEDFRAWTKRGQEVCNKLADLSVPSACAIAGGCFDAGLERNAIIGSSFRHKQGNRLRRTRMGMITAGVARNDSHLVGLDNVCFGQQGNVSTQKRRGNAGSWTI